MSYTIILREMTEEELLASRRRQPLTSYERWCTGRLSFQDHMQRTTPHEPRRLPQGDEE